jgi:hypothetical protein
MPLCLPLGFGYKICPFEELNSYRFVFPYHLSNSAVDPLHALMKEEAVGWALGYPELVLFVSTN